MVMRAMRRPSIPWPTMSSGRIAFLAGDGVMGGGGQRDEDAGLASSPAGRATVARAREARCARQHRRTAPRSRRSSWRRERRRVTSAKPRRCTGADHPADRFVTGNEGIAHAGEVGHAAGPQQALGAGTDAASNRRTTMSSALAPADASVLSARLLRLFQNDCDRLHLRSPSEPPAAELGRFVRVPVVTLL